MSGVSTQPKITSGGVELSQDPQDFGFLRSSNDLIGDFGALQMRLDEDGYLYLPGFLDQEEVREVRRSITQVFGDEGHLNPDFPVLDAVAREGLEMYFRADIANKNQPLKNLIYSDHVMALYTGLLGGPAMHYDYTWMRAIAPGKGTFPHCDIVYMGRGTKHVLTAWVPLGDVPLNVGGLVLMPGSHKIQWLKESYGTLDVDSACSNVFGKNQTAAAGFEANGAIQSDPEALRIRLGGKWCTAQEYKMGDLLTFSVFTVHGSLDNHSNEIRLSSDSRYQLASEPADERWIGDDPISHGPNAKKSLIC